MNSMINEEINILKCEVELIRERYSKLLDAHRQLQSENSRLEEQILSIVEKYSNEKEKLEQDLVDCKHEIVHLKDTVNQIELEKQRYKDDCNLAVRLLHRCPNDFISTKFIQNQEQTTNEFASIKSEQRKSPQDNVLLPTYPPMLVTPNSFFNTSCQLDSSNSTTVIDNLQLAESLFKSNTVHRYPSTNFICAKCHETIKYSDVSVQTRLDNSANFRCRMRHVSMNSSDDDSKAPVETNKHVGTNAIAHEYQISKARKSMPDMQQSSKLFPQMHHV